MADAEVTGEVLNFDDLVNIFSYVCPRHLANASRVCQKTWKRYYIARRKVDTGAATGRPGLDYVCKSLRGHRGSVTDVIFITTNDIYDERIIEKSAHPLVASCGQDKNVGIWNTREGKSLWRKSDGHDTSVSCLELIKPNALFASGDDMGVVNLWDVTTGEHTKLQEEHSSIAQIVCESNRNGLFVASRSGEVKIWDVRDTTKSQLTIQSPLLGLKLMKVKGNQTLVLAGTDSVFNTSPGIKVYDIRNLIPEGFAARQQDFQPPNSSLNHPSSSTPSCLCWIPNRPNQLAAGYNNGSIMIWDVNSGQEVYSFRPHVGSVTAVAAVGCKVISAGTECSLSVWDLDKKKSLGSFVDHNSQITDIYADAFKVMSCSRDFSIRVYSWVEVKDIDGINYRHEQFTTVSARHAAIKADKKLTFVPLVFILCRIWGTVRFLISVTNYNMNIKGEHGLEWLVYLQITNKTEFLDHG
ncbi:hypothetical protein QZH41_002134 [Actinostola sp. cb2023]|nr:hypothetical protein QZH41_002134 [Actinostola sp. cb2023]